MIRMVLRSGGAVLAVWVLASGVPVSRGWAAETYRFQYRPPAVGQEMSHELRFAIDATIALQQAGQVIESKRYAVDRRQRRRITILETTKDFVSKARVHYELAQQTVTSPAAEEPGKPRPGAQPDSPAETTVKQPVAGRSYVVARIDGRLRVEDADGGKPSEEEVAIVTANMDAIGRPNPLARFFAGRSVAVGEALKLPEPLARDLFGLDDGLGRVSGFSMKLVKVEPVAGAACGFFETTIALSSGDGKKATTDVRGTMVVQVETCRGVSVELTGPISVRETRTAGGARYETTCQGKLALSITSAERK
jgi:hypothetical protein